ncbi:caspase recruitment domain-containing protein 18-like [Kryptolebias marmoratus]|uniref:Caspase recruitment domain-containing protein 18-like n=1 Tax=Kryptolebias marmoratus TaxID=37003 RepID=A0A3Q3BDR2_KRYMA|nr:caspase recruitment domain-containing protein 18-like [Kryptolebias marmoratus]XP_037829660.1 caspase recruitment domain-containing protein 18-like [Kryptolebias marmoratus]
MAEATLDKIRRDFVERSSKELINQLLDDLFADRILNEGEKDAILEENKSRVDKARCLLDSVKRKGNEASGKMIEHLQRRDPTLSSQLGL